MKFIRCECHGSLPTAVNSSLLLSGIEKREIKTKQCMIHKVSSLVFFIPNWWLSLVFMWNNKDRTLLLISGFFSWQDNMLIENVRLQSI